jgi:hypothetical protein
MGSDGRVRGTTGVCLLRCHGAVMDRWYAANARVVIHHTLGEGARIGITTRYIRCVDITKRK